MARICSQWAITNVFAIVSLMLSIAYCKQCHWNQSYSFVSYVAITGVNTVNRPLITFSSYLPPTKFLGPLLLQYLTKGSKSNYLHGISIDTNALSRLFVELPLYIPRDSIDKSSGPCCEYIKNRQTVSLDELLLL